MNRNYETQILDAIQMLVDNAVSKADYDKTIKATISRCVDPTIGKYVIRYQDSSFYAYSYNTDITYPQGTTVYVLVPGNDMTQEKSIIGTVDKLGIDYVSIVEGENGYEVTGVNTINAPEAPFGLCSYKKEDLQILYNRDNGIDLINLDTFGLKTYMQQASSIICGATFRTNLNTEQKFQGDYGIVFDLDFIDNATGETVTRTYLINVDQMTGQPYNFLTDSRQYGIFDVDGTNFVSVKQIYIFSYGFPKATADDSIIRDNDIFISKFELCAAKALDRAEASTAALTFITPQGIYFDDTHLDTETRTIEAQVRIKGQAIDNESQNVKYYWFRENNKISPQSDVYNRYGGSGWECLNAKNIIEEASEDSSALVEWVPGEYQYTTTKLENTAKETKYKCIAVYNNETVLNKTIIIYNYSSEFDITIVSDEGTTFYYDLGNPTLTCKINGEEFFGNEYEYVWSAIDNNNRFINIEETTTLNEEYNDALEHYTELQNQIENNIILEGSAKEELELYRNILDQYEYIMRVEGNKIHQLKVSDITNFTTYRCSVFKMGIALGTASIIISNNLQNETGYNLVINNGDQVFKYNEHGIAPNNQTLENPISILPLTFTLYDTLGREVSSEAIGLQNIKWTIPDTDTLLTIAEGQGISTESTNQGKVYQGLDALSFNIATKYNAAKNNNTIYLSINYKEHTLTARTNLTFIKTGEVGTNGTDFICKIVPNIQGALTNLNYPTVIYNERLKTYKLNFDSVSASKWFKIQLWHDGEPIFEGTQTGWSSEGTEVRVSWSILKNNYGNEISDSSNLTIDELTGAITFDSAVYEHPANIIKCTLSYDGVDYYATMPVVISRIKDENYEILLDDNSGFKSVMYTTDGRNPAYATERPHEIIVTQIINGVKNNISRYELDDYKVNYNWSVRGAVYFSEWQLASNLATKYSTSVRETRNQKYFQPLETYNGLCLSNAVQCEITQNGERIGSIHMPIHLYLNRYGNSAMNGWDGNSISLGEHGEGLILAPQVGAGAKNSDNSFTGVFMGEVKETDKKETEYGLFGYNAGERTITLSSTDGSARFGKTGSGQIIIDPSSGEALLTSGNFDEEAGTGMEINLSEPSIKFGSGNFEVDKNGQIWATQYATKNMKFSSSSVDGLDDHLQDLDTNLGDLEASINYLDVVIPTNNIVIETDTSRFPVATATKTIECVTTYKGTTVRPFVQISGSHTGITNVTSSYDTGRGVVILSFHVDTSTAIANSTNDYNVTFSYNADDCSPVTKIISVLTLEKGKDGTSVNIKGTEANITALCQNHASGNILGDGYILDDNGNGDSGHLFIFTNTGKGNGRLPDDWKDVGKIQGQDGQNGRGVQSIYYMYLLDNTAVKPEANDPDWKDIMPTPTAVNRYLWQKEIITFIEPNGSTTVQETVLLLAVYGETGTGIKSTEVKYQKGDSGTVFPIGDWLDNPPEVEPGKYLWTRIRITYTTGGSPVDSYAVTYMGTDGDPGSNGVGIKSFTEYYAISATQPAINSSLWQTTIPTYIENQFYWKKTVTIWTDTTPDTVTIIKDEALTTANKKAAAAETKAQNASDAAKSAQDAIDNLDVGGKNFILNSGDFNEDLSPWTLHEGNLLEIVEENERRLIHAIGSITQAESYLLDFDTEYVCHMYAKFSQSGTPTITDPLYWQVWGHDTITTDRPEGYQSATESATIYVDDIENGSIQSGKWHHITIKFKTKKQTDVNTSYVLIKIFMDGDLFITNKEYWLRWIKLEEGNIPTDWSPAPEEVNDNVDSVKNAADTAKTSAEDAKELAGIVQEQLAQKDDLIKGLSDAQTALSETITLNKNASIKDVYIEYCQKDYSWDTIPVNSAYDPGLVYYQYDEETSSYIKIRPRVENGLITETTYKKGILPTPAENDPGWNRVKPQWKDGTGTYQRTTIEYHEEGRDPDYSAIYLMEDYQTIDDLRYKDATNVLNTMRGTNYIFYNEDGLFVYDGATQNDSRNAIIINKEGICFQHREAITDPWPTPTSVWTIDGRFNAKDILVENLNAEAIVDGILTLGSQSKDGELRIQDDQHRRLMEFNTQRAKWTLNNGHTLIIGKDCGFQVIDTWGNQVYGNSLVWSLVTGGTYQNNINYYYDRNLLNLIPEYEVDENGNIELLQGQPIPSSGVCTVTYTETFEFFGEQKISGSTNYGDIIQVINIDTTDQNSIRHRGIAFVPRQ